MSDAWVIVSADSDEARGLAATLLAQRHRVAVIAPDVQPFALLVNEHADAVITAELDEPDLLALTEAMWSIEENFGGVDVIAFVGGDDEPARVQQAVDFFGDRWPTAEIIAPAQRSSTTTPGGTTSGTTGAAHCPA